MPPAASYPGELRDSYVRMYEPILCRRTALRRPREREMPQQTLAARELAKVFRVLSNPDRIRLIEELRESEKDVQTLRKALDLPQPRVSQHLATLRAHRLATERREGHQIYYRLTQPALAAWIVRGLVFVERELEEGGRKLRAVEQARTEWS